MLRKDGIRGSFLGLVLLRTFIDDLELGETSGIVTLAGDIQLFRVAKIIRDCKKPIREMGIKMSDVI